MRDPLSPEDTKYYIVSEECIACGVCVKQCLSKAILHEEGTDEYRILPEECVSCGICSIYCPTDAILKD